MAKSDEAVSIENGAGKAVKKYRQDEAY